MTNVFFGSPEPGIEFIDAIRRLLLIKCRVLRCRVPGCGPGHDALTHRVHLRRPWEEARLWAPSDRLALRRMCEYVAVNASAHD